MLYVCLVVEKTKDEEDLFLEKVKSTRLFPVT